jgi:hypothetical protein
MAAGESLSEVNPRVAHQEASSQPRAEGCTSRIWSVRSQPEVSFLYIASSSLHRRCFALGPSGFPQFHSFSLALDQKPRLRRAPQREYRYEGFLLGAARIQGDMLREHGAPETLDLTTPSSHGSLRLAIRFLYPA